MPREGSRETYRIHQGRVVIVVPRIKVINVLYVFHAVNFSLANGEKHCCSNGMTTMYNISYQSNSRTRKASWVGPSVLGWKSSVHSTCCTAQSILDTGIQ